jgi:hypothetical protein
VAKEEELMGVSEMKNRSNDIAIGMVKGISKVGITYFSRFSQQSRIRSKLS